MQAIITPLGSDVLCRCPQSGTELRLPADAVQRLCNDWGQRYHAALDHAALDHGSGDALPGVLFELGSEMFDALDANGWAGSWRNGTGARVLEIRVEGIDDPLSQALLDAPWELLATAERHLVDDAAQVFEIVRRIGTPTSPLAPRHGDLQLLFMAAAPRGVHELDFEAEESAILAATHSLPTALSVEESGSAERLGERHHLDGPFEVVHLSCHGDIDASTGPLLALEDDTGALTPATPAQLLRELGDADQLPLLFLSACRTAEAENRRDGSATEPYARALTRAGIANVLGWDGSVYDHDAQRFATLFYRELGLRVAVPRAVALARQGLRQAMLTDPKQGRHWHLARLYLAPHGGGPLIAAGLRRRRRPGDSAGQAFLDPARGEVPVAKPHEFVGRRRALQDVLRAFRDDAVTGVLVQGMGNLGKSSLAARVAARLSRLKTVVVFKHYDALHVFDRLADALPPARRRGFIDTWRAGLLDQPEVLGDALEAMLDDPLAGQPILLIVDDLERALETPGPSEHPTPVGPAYRAVLRAIITAFARARGDSRLLFTSRYRFTLPDRDGNELAASLGHVALNPMPARERLKQLHAALRAGGDDAPALDDAARNLLDEALDLAAGNPGLQATLTAPILGGERSVAHDALAAIRHYQRHGHPPAAIEALLGEDGSGAEGDGAGDPRNAIVAFFKRMAFATYRASLTPAQGEMLAVLCLFEDGMPIPASAALAAADASGIADSAAALARLRGLGLADSYRDPDGSEAVAANPLARPLAIPLAPSRIAAARQAAAAALDRAWRDDDGDLPHDSRARLLTELWLEHPAPDPARLDAAATAAAFFLFQGEYRAEEALATILRPTLARLASAATQPCVWLLRATLDCARHAGDPEMTARAVALLESATAEGADLANTRLGLARHYARQGAMSAAETAYRAAADVFRELRRERDAAIASGGIADILQARGQLDDALRIRQIEQLPVFTKLGDIREVAVTQGKIADMLQARGQLDDALRIHQVEELPVYTKLGDAREILVAQAKIAMLLLQRGHAEDRADAQEKLMAALREAQRMQLPEVAQIVGIMVHFDVLPEALPALPEQAPDGGE
ncbi:MAG: CHAT domain-containing protein [Zoogloeaceae bacterium]|nr:CHAT domain-containing protein [Zoogloeaceae bacterium]